MQFGIAQTDTRYGKFLFFPNDDPIGACLHFYGEWAQQEFDLFDKFLTEDSFVLDIGANIGTHTVYFAKKCPKGVVYAIEPQLYISELLNANIIVNGCLNVVPMMAACHSENKRIRIVNIHPISETPKINYGMFKLEEKEKGCMISCYTVDTLAEHFPRLDLIKIDVEGLEIEVLNGAKETLDRLKPRLYLEYNNKEGSPDLYDKIIELGYIPYWHIYPKFNPNNFKQKTQNIWEEVGYSIDKQNLDKRFEANVICIHKDNDQPTGLREVKAGETITTFLFDEGLI